MADKKTKSIDTFYIPGTPYPQPHGQLSHSAEILDEPVTEGEATGFSYT